MSKKRVPLIIVERVVPHYRHALFSELHRKFGWHVVCAATPPSGTGHKFLTDAEYILPYPYEFPDPWNHFRVVMPMNRILAELRPEAVISDFAPLATYTRSLAMRRFLGCSPLTMFWSHGSGTHRAGMSLKDRLIAAVRLAVMRQADGHVVYSSEGKAYLDRHVDPATVFVAPNALDNDVFRTAAAKAQAREGFSRPVLLSVARFSEDKNHALLIRAFKLLLRKIPNATLVLVGTGPKEPRLRELAGETGGRIVFAGPVYDEVELASYFNASDVFVVPGAAGLSVNHALGYGVPVVAFERDITGPFHHPEIVNVREGLTGWRIRPYTDEALADFLSALFMREPSPAAVMRPRIEDYVEKNMSIEWMVKGFAEARMFLISRGAKNI